MKQSLTFNTTGSLVNWMMGNNQTIPEIGKGATMLFHSDRHAYEVIDVNEKSKSVVIQRYHPKRVDKLGMSDQQSYEYNELIEGTITLYYKWGSWKKKHVGFTFTDEAHKKYGNHGKLLNEAFSKAGGVYNGVFINSLIEGLTKLKIEWTTVNIIFGVKQEYYDYSF